MIRFLENSWTDVRTYGSMDGQTLFHRPFRPWPGSIKNFDSYLWIELIERYNFYFQILIKRKIPGQKNIIQVFKKFPGFPGHTIKSQVFFRFSRSAGNPDLMLHPIISFIIFFILVPCLPYNRRVLVENVEVKNYYMKIFICNVKNTIFNTKPIEL